MNKNSCFRCFSMLWHAVSAWNTGGEGIHSPQLFYLVRHLFYESAQLYCWQEIEDRRQAMLRAPKLIHVTDFGTGKDRDEMVMHIARNSLMERKYVQILSRVLHYVSGDEYVPDRKRALRVLELGTSLGITTAYLAQTAPQNQVVTFEGCQEIVEMAHLNWTKLNVKNVRCLVGNIDDTLYNYAREEMSSLDFVLMDANHTCEATLRYFSWIAPKMDINGIVVVDDIRYSKDMYAAWKMITQHQGVTATMDLGRMGLVFFNPQYQQRTYYIRL